MTLPFSPEAEEDLVAIVFDLAAGYGIDGLIGLSFLGRFDYEVRSIDGEIRVERATSQPTR